MEREIFLRPHHGLCLRFYEGKGYDGAFCRNMTAVRRALTPETAVRLAPGYDDLCACCPQRNSGCPGAAKYDSAVRTLCGLQTGGLIRWDVWQERLERQILTPGKLGEICGDCQWYGICGKNSSK